jgi:hypothetical protein
LAIDAQGLAGIESLDGLGQLIVRKLSLATELHAVRQGPFSAVAGAVVQSTNIALLNNYMASMFATSAFTLTVETQPPRPRI